MASFLYLGLTGVFGWRIRLTIAEIRIRPVINASNVGKGFRLFTEIIVTKNME